MQHNMKSPADIPGPPEFPQNLSPDLKAEWDRLLTAQGWNVSFRTELKLVALMARFLWRIRKKKTSMGSIWVARRYFHERCRQIRKRQKGLRLGADTDAAGWARLTPAARTPLQPPGRET